jgi:hypothetical protein
MPTRLVARMVKPIPSSALKVVAGEGSGLFASSEGTGPDAGAGGNVALDVGRLELQGGAVVTASTLGPGDGGDLMVVADEVVAAGTALAVVGPGEALGRFETLREMPNTRLDRSGLSASSLNPGLEGGRVGTIRLSASTITLADGAAIATVRAGGRADDAEAGAAGPLPGSIIIDAMDALRLSGDALITAETEATDAGDIVITAGRLLDLEDSAITTSVAGGRGGGGNISIDPEFVVLDSSRIVANAFEGTGGNIRIAADHFLLSPDSVVDASSELGLPGTVAITAPELDVAGGLVSPQAEFLDPNVRLRERCDVRRTTGAGSFTGVGRGGPDLSPDAPLPAFSSDLAKAAQAESAGVAGYGKFGSSAIAISACSRPLRTSVSLLCALASAAKR